MIEIELAEGRPEEGGGWRAWVTWRGDLRGFVVRKVTRRFMTPEEALNWAHKTAREWQEQHGR